MNRGTWAVAGAVSTTTVSVLPVFLTGGLAVQISAELRFDPAGLGLIVALFFGISAFAALPCGWLVERYGSGTTSRVAVLGAAAVMGGVALFARSYPALVAILLCSAWCNVLGQLSSNLTLARYVQPEKLGLSFGIKQSAIPTATLLSGAAVPAVALTIGWRWAFAIGAALALAALLITPREDAGRARTVATPGERATAALSVIGSAAGLAAASCTALGIFLVASAVDRGIDPGTAGLTLTLGSVVGLVLRLAHGWAADHRSGGHIAVVAASLVLGAGGLALLAVPGTPALVVGTVLGFGLGWAWPGLLQFAVVRLNPSAPAAATSIIQVGVYGGGFLGPVGFGFLATHFSFPIAWLVGAATMVVAAVLMVLGRRMLVAHRVAREATPA
ncbi:MFS transporter [Pseudonocardia abyssalis]|uniref:MFS transporter n=1 Tax=Pseudonocardia abyssalis TaxID=2792008 RepID=A0ABS6UX08_9PSEU|nr:MFS transporter [Pseudonocardia abyssalis]MBW0116722.1 MFS transporter [Pseudonocardia abyssalis]MBW0136805.1 MFS transporter [Pseudonocardia abyssalis]